MAVDSGRGGTVGEDINHRQTREVFGEQLIVARIDMYHATSVGAGSNRLLITAQVKVNQQTNIDEMSAKKSTHVAETSRTRTSFSLPVQWFSNSSKTQSFLGEQI